MDRVHHTQISTSNILEKALRLSVVQFTIIIYVCFIKDRPICIYPSDRARSNLLLSIKPILLFVIITSFLVPILVECVKLVIGQTCYPGSFLCTDIVFILAESRHPADDVHSS